MIRNFTFFTIALFSLSIFSQNLEKKVTVKYITDVITMDGVLDEDVWNNADSAKDFWQYFPSDSIHAKHQSEIKMLFDDKNLYLGIKVLASGNDYIIASLKRDFRAGGSDNITMMFDTYSDGNNAFLFGVNPYGVRREGLVSGGGTDLRGFNISWDTKWNAETKIYDGYYISELVIPLSAFKFKEGETKWRFNSYRFDTQSNESSTWMKIPRNQYIFGLAFMGVMEFERPLGKPKAPISLIPYINAIASKDYQNNFNDSSVKVGGDAKIAIGSSLNLDITINPDFSQVEVDDQVVNLTRFEVSLPEKRQFFIDNSDLFGDFGDSRDANPFFSRRIGIAHDKNGNSVENRILAGARLSGKLNRNWRIGLLNIQTEENVEEEIPSNNNTVFALQRKMFSRSNIGMIFINRQSFKDYAFVENKDKYNRLIGLDYNLASPDNTWTGKAYLHKSFQPEGGDKDLSTGGGLEYNSKYFNAFVDGNYIGNDFRSDLGFIRRTDVLKNVSMIEGVIWPKKGKVTSHNFRVFNVFTYRPELDFKLTDRSLNATWEAKFNNQSELEFRLSNKFTHLLGEFDPTNSLEGVIVKLPSNTDYNYTSLSAEFKSDRRKAFTFGFKPSIGQFFNGHKSSVQASFGFRIQPKFLASIKLDYHRIELPEPYLSTSIWLIGSKIDVTFNKSTTWSTFVQYSHNKNNDLQNNFGVNSRLQWRFAPLSDLFLVYNDNYFVSNYTPRFRSINLKFTYWLNI